VTVPVIVFAVAFEPTVAASVRGEPSVVPDGVATRVVFVGASAVHALTKLATSSEPRPVTRS
jgi:hypothetical protein